MGIDNCLGATQSVVKAQQKALHTAKLYYIEPYMNLRQVVASGGKLQSLLAKKLVSFLAWVKVGSLQDITINDEGRKTLQKRDLQY